MTKEEAIKILETVSEPSFKHTNQSAAMAFVALGTFKDEKIVDHLKAICEPNHQHTTESGFVAYNILSFLKNASEQNSECGGA